MSTPKIDVMLPVAHTTPRAVRLPIMSAAPSSDWRIDQLEARVSAIEQALILMSTGREGCQCECPHKKGK
jgi:hypothetical protein